MYNRAVIFAGGKMHDYNFCKNEITQSDYIICADGGIAHSRALGIKPHVLLGDFDSSSLEHDLTDVEVMKYPPEKDKTDTHLAIDVAIEKGFKNVLILGALGGRIDHELANIFLLKYMIENGVLGMISDEKNDVFLIDRSAELKNTGKKYLSLIAISDKVTGITTENLLYPLNDYTLCFGTSRAISNEFCKDSAKVHIKDGLLLVVYSSD